MPAKAAAMKAKEKCMTDDIAETGSLKRRYG